MKRLLLKLVVYLAVTLFLGLDCLSSYSKQIVPSVVILCFVLPGVMVGGVWAFIELMLWKEDKE